VQVGRRNPQTNLGIKKQWRRTIRAELRDIRVLLQESRGPLILFVTLVVGGALVLRFFYTFPGTDQHPGLSESLYAMFGLIFFNPTLEFPGEWYLQILFFVIPIVGLVAVADGILRFGVALVSKSDRAQKWQVAMASTYKDHVIVCGVGKVGYRVILELFKFGQDIVAIEPDAEGRFVEKVKALGVPVIAADARRSANLIQAGVERADAIIPCTDDELANLDIALDAREINPGIKVVMRTFDADLARRIEKGFGIHTAFSTSALAAPSFAAAAMRFNVEHSFYVGDSLLNLSHVDIEPDSKLVGWSIERVESDLELSVICHQAGERTNMHPDPGLTLRPGSRILVMASLEALRQLNDLNQPESAGRGESHS
jgi:voltage-gated potassium channel